MPGKDHALTEEVIVRLQHLVQLHLQSVDLFSTSVDAVVEDILNSFLEGRRENETSDRNEEEDEEKASAHVDLDVLRRETFAMIDRYLLSVSDVSSEEDSNEEADDDRGVAMEEDSASEDERSLEENAEEQDDERGTQKKMRVRRSSQRDTSATTTDEDSRSNRLPRKRRNTSVGKSSSRRGASQARVPRDITKEELDVIRAVQILKKRIRTCRWSLPMNTWKGCSPYEALHNIQEFLRGKGIEGRLTKEKVSEIVLLSSTTNEAESILPAVS